MISELLLNSMYLINRLFLSFTFECDAFYHFEKIFFIFSYSIFNGFTIFKITFKSNLITTKTKHDKNNRKIENILFAECDLFESFSSMDLHLLDDVLFFYKTLAQNHIQFFIEIYFGFATH